MSITIYKCDTCKRELELVPNKFGTNLTNVCIITEGCKGSLYKTGERATGVFGKAVDDVEGLDNFRARTVLNVFDQTLSNSSWVIEHNLNTDPVVHVYIDTIVDGIETQLIQEIDDYVVVFVDNNNIRIEFATSTTGTAHIIARSTKPEPVDLINTPTIFDQITANNILTIGSVFRDVNPQLLTLEMNFISPSTGIITTLDVDFTAHKFDTNISLFNTPWQSIDTMSVGGNVFKLRSVRMSDITSPNDIEEGSPFYFSDTNNWIILLSTSPYATHTVDLNVSEYFSPEILSSDNTNPNSSSTDNELFIDVTAKTQYHPQIKITTTIF